MPPTPPSTTSSSAGHSPPDPQFRVVRKRNRVPLSCGPCRHRKLKCNRGHPCDNCTKRGDMGSCTYAAPGNRKKSAASAGAATSPDDMQNRIDRLEGLVLSLMTNGAQSAGPAAAQAAIAQSMSSASPDQHYDIGTMVGGMNGAPESIVEEEGAEESDMETVTKSIGVMKMHNNSTVFASEAHWYAILGEISEVKNYFAEHKKQYDDQLKRYKASQSDEPPPGTAFLYGARKTTSKADILSQFPPKQTADILVSRFFNTYDPGFHIIHGPTFQKEYDRHWLNQEESPIIWLGLVFSMMCIALQSYTRAGDEPPEYHNKSWAMSKEYRDLTAQCLVMADITQPIIGMLETLILHVHAEYARSRDAEVGILISTGIIVRLAMRMGLHRDSGPYPNISVFQGEMRRRVWAAIRSIDLLFSAQAGLPPIVRPRDTNTEVPRNIYDDELFEDMKILPPSRPETEATPTLFLINRTRLIYKLGEAVELTDTLTCTSYAEVMKIDAEARELHEKTSPYLKIRTMDESARDPSTIIMQRFTLDLLYLKIMCVLHRKFLTYARVQSRFSYSRTAVMDASMIMLQHQATLHRECQPGGRLRNVKWFISSLTTVDFLLAAMIIASDLYHTLGSGGQRRPSDNILRNAERINEMLDAMETAVNIWEGLKDNSMEAYKVHATLSVMLNQLKKDRPMKQPQQNGFQAATSAFPAPSPMDESNVAPEHSAAMTLGMLSTGGMASSSANMFEQRYPASMANLLNDPVPQQSTGLTPQYNGATSGPGIENGASPFSNLFGANLFQNLDLPPTDNLNWDAWDSYIQGPTAAIDSANNFFPMEFGVMPMQTDAPGLPNEIPVSQNSGNQRQTRTNAFGQNVFMGADTKSNPSEGYTMNFMVPKRSP
ncbi:fungal-specific transcription factor domain-containing protein [Phaeosphaeriaceae sp. PMI808]|nr:fungal-specific transcription factor domain-containing protein [Phaeosphaeriaceae sp. PMI808]